MADPIKSSNPNPFTCAATSEYTFCVPKQAGGAFLLGVHADPPLATAHDTARIRRWLMHPSAQLSRLAASTPGLPPVPNARWYDVSAAFPPNIVQRNGTRDGLGPNCYATALESAGYAHLGHRHVAPDEFRYYLKRDYEPMPACGEAPPPGTVVVYERHPSTYSAGAHAAIALLGGLVFHRGGWSHDYPYEAVPLRGAMLAIDRHYVPRGDDRFRGGPPGGASTGYKHRCYRRRATPLARRTSATQQDRQWFLPLFRYYIHRLRVANAVRWSDFRKERPDLLTIENMWHIKRAFSERLGNMNRTDVLLALDDDVAQAYLELESLSWQFHALSERAAPRSPGRTDGYLQELYREHYVTFDFPFYEELGVHLNLRGVPREKHRQAVQVIERRIKQYDPMQYVGSNGGRGIPYLQIVDEVAKRFTPRR